MKIQKIKDIYLYTHTNAFLVRFLALLGIFSVLLMSYGYVLFLNLSPIYWLIFGPFAVLILFTNLTRNIVQLNFPRFDKKNHENIVHNFIEKRQKPSVDIFLPWAGEDIAVYDETIRGAMGINYPSYEIYLLDDKGSDEVKLLAEKYHIKYLSRPNKGEFRKSGNLQYGYDHSSGKYVLVLDADFVPHSEILMNTLPYLELDYKMGILQTPQYFDQSDEIHKKSHIEYGGGNIVEDFYRIDMPARNKFKAAICVGTSAIYRREAVELSGGLPKVWGTEDVRQGLKITRAGFYVWYLPLVLSIGVSPDDYQSYFRQHNRWCSGSIDTLFGEYFTKAKLSIWARLIYLTNATYYIGEAGNVIFGFHFLALLAFHSESLSISNALYFIPYMLLTKLIRPLIRVHKSKYGSNMAAFNNIYTYFYTIPRIPFKKVLAWHPAGVKMGTLQSEFLSAINIGIFFSTIYLFLFILIILREPELLGNYNGYLLLFWAIYTSFWHIKYLHSASSYIHKELSKVFNSIESNLNKILNLSLSRARISITPILAFFLIISMTSGITQVLSDSTDSPSESLFKNALLTDQDSQKFNIKPYLDTGHVDDELATTSSIQNSDTKSADEQNTTAVIVSKPQVDYRSQRLINRFAYPSLSTPHKMLAIINPEGVFSKSCPSRNCNNINFYEYRKNVNMNTDVELVYTDGYLWGMTSDGSYLPLENQNDKYRNVMVGATYNITSTLTPITEKGLIARTCPSVKCVQVKLYQKNESITMSSFSDIILADGLRWGLTTQGSYVGFEKSDFSEIYIKEYVPVYPK